MTAEIKVGKTLYEIVDQAKSGGMPTHEECYWAMLALSHLQSLDQQRLLKLSVEQNATLLTKLSSSESFKRLKSALDKPPQDWLGQSYDPKDIVYQKDRMVGLKLLKKAME